MRTHSFAILLCFSASCTTPMPRADAATGNDAARSEDSSTERDVGATHDSAVDAAAPDAASEDGGGPVDAFRGVDAASADASGPDAARTDAGCVENNSVGTVDGRTVDVFGDDFRREVLTVTLCTPVRAGESVTVHFVARITAAGIDFNYDYFGTAVYINGVGDYRDTLMTWTYVTVSGDTFAEYSLVLPADINRDGTVDWVTGANMLDVTTWSGYNDRPGNTGVDAIWITH